MRIAIVGGVERTAPRLRAAADQAGHALEFHPGHVSGPQSTRLRAMVERSDLVVVVTGVNSHTAVLHARSLARDTGRPLRFVRRLGPSQLRALIA